MYIMSMASSPMWYSAAMADATVDARQHRAGVVDETRAALAVIGFGTVVHLRGRWRCRQRDGTFHDVV
jgi:hypothetical protein